MELFYILLVLLVTTRLFGELAARVGQPQLVGELLAGVALGAVAQGFKARFPTLAELPDNEVFGAVTNLSIFFLMLVAGVEMRPSELARRSGTALCIAAGGIALPLALGFGIARLWLPDSGALLAQSLVVGLTLAITAVPVSVSVLMQLGALDTKIGNIIVGSAVFDDILSLVLLAIVMSVAIDHEPISLANLGLLGGRVALFFAITFALGSWLLPRAGRLTKRFRLEHSEISLVIVWGLFVAVLGEFLDMHFAVGAFAAGLLFRRSTIDEQAYLALRDRLEAVTLGFLAPLFFASIGLELHASALVEAPWFVLTLVVAAFAGKFFGAGLVARASGFDNWESFAIGAGMNARGAVALIVASIALDAGVFDTPTPTPPEIENLYSALVIVAIATTVLSPILIRYALRRET